VDKTRDETAELFRITSRLFLFLTAFRRRVRKGLRVELRDVSDRLDEIFAEMARDAREEPRLEALYERARYPLVVLADEVLLHSGWEYVTQWERQLLEEKVFGTNIGGEKFFTIAKELDPSRDAPLAAILSAAIALGFGGKYRERPEKLEEARKRLYLMSAPWVASLGEKLTPDAYNVLPQPAKKLSPLINLYRVAIVAFGVLVLYYLLAFVLWGGAMGELRQAAHAIGVS
jgi:type IV/VI secretion system ImpK/VasF family protein